MSENFSELNIGDGIARRLSGMGISRPTAVQEKVIPLVAGGRNVMFQSETGTGKTFAYLLPLLSRIEAEDPDGKDVRVMIASPTYELASQIKVLAQSVSSIKSALFIGGAPLSRQIESLKQKPRIAIGGSARLLELIHLKKLKADSVRVLVLDEADRLLSREMRGDTEALLARLPPSVQLIGNSATVSDYTRKALEKARAGAHGEGAELGEGIMFVELPREDVLRSRIEHWAIFAERRDKIDTLRSFIRALKPQKLIVFTSRPDQVENIAAKLRYRNIELETLSARTDKVARKSAIDRFKSGKSRILVTTDLAARGLDIQGITHVVQMDLGEESDFFVHRAGRTARAGASGFNCVIGDRVEMERYSRLEKRLGIVVHPKALYEGRLVEP